MKIAIAVVLFIVGAVFAANALGSLSGRYGSANVSRNVLVAGGIAAAAFVAGYVLISS